MRRRLLQGGTRELFKLMALFCILLVVVEVAWLYLITKFYQAIHIKRVNCIVYKLYLNKTIIKKWTWHGVGTDFIRAGDVGPKQQFYRGMGWSPKKPPLTWRCRHFPAKEGPWRSNREERETLILEWRLPHSPLCCWLVSVPQVIRDRGGSKLYLRGLWEEWGLLNELTDRNIAT